MKTSPLLAITALAACMSLSSCSGEMRNSIRAVGSSTVYPFAKVVSERFARSHPEYKSPIIESTGTGGGMKLFCAGLGSATPDLANASRRMKAKEFATCQENGVTEITEIQVGLDGIAFASAQGGIDMNLTPEIVYRALAANPYGQPQTAENWSDIDPSLPNKPILIYGPPPGSGTRDALTELVLEAGCEANPAMEAIKEQDKDRFKRICTEIRSGSGYVSQGEQDNLIVQKIESNPDAVGLFGFSYLEKNADKVQGLSMNGVEPTFENISDFSYPGARPLFVYVKNAHLQALPGLREFMARWVIEWQPEGSLSKIGLVCNPDEQAIISELAATQFIPLTAADFE